MIEAIVALVLMLVGWVIAVGKAALICFLAVVGVAAWDFFFEHIW